MFWFYLLVFVLSAIFLSFQYVYSYWRRKGFPYIVPTMPFGNIAAAALRQKSVGMTLYDLHRKSKEKIVGVYMLFRPALMVRDADLVKAILATDFQHFHDRGIFHADPKHDPMALNLLSMKGQMWKSLRTKLTPAFTSGKLKGMMPTIMDISDKLLRKLEPKAVKNEIVDMKDLMTRWVLNTDYLMWTNWLEFLYSIIRFAMDIVGTVSFGLNVNTIDSVDELYLKIEKTVNNGNFINSIRTIGTFLCPE